MARQLAKMRQNGKRRGSSGTARRRSPRSRRIGPTAYRELVERRIKLIETNKEIASDREAEYKRRWNTEPWDEQEQRALKNWLLDRLEDTEVLANARTRPQLTTRTAGRP